MIKMCLGVERYWGDHLNEIIVISHYTELISYIIIFVIIFWNSIL